MKVMTCYSADCLKSRFDISTLQILSRFLLDIGRLRSQNTRGSFGSTARSQSLKLTSTVPSVKPWRSGQREAGKEVRPHELMPAVSRSGP